MNLKIEVRGVSDSIRQVETDYREFLERVADTIVTEAPKFTPKKTGRAAAGWEKKMEKDNFSVENRVPYVGYLEKPFVKSKQAPRVLLAPH